MTIREKLLVVQTELNAPKNRMNKFGGYSYRSCEDILEALKPILKKVKAVIKLTDNIIMIGDRIYVNAPSSFSAASRCRSACSGLPASRAVSACRSSSAARSAESFRSRCSSSFACSASCSADSRA